jgi:anti-anti-sigma factor
MREETAQFATKLDKVEQVRIFVQQFMANAHLTDEQIYNFQIAVDEHFVNLVEHAFDGNSTHYITIACQEDDQKAQIIIRDSSKGFDPRNYSIPNIAETPIAEVSPGGFGNYFISELIDEVEYIHRPYDNNELILTMYTQGTQYEPAMPKEEVDMNVQVRRSEQQEDVHIVEVEGRIAADTAPEVEAALKSLLEQESVKIIVDFANVSYISSGGLRVFLTALKQARARNGDVKLVRLIPNVEKIFKLAGFTKIFTIMGSVENALDAFSS